MLTNPVLITGIVFVGLFAILSVLDCFLGEDGWYLADLKQAQDAKHYFGILIKPFHAHLINAILSFMTQYNIEIFQYWKNKLCQSDNKLFFKSNNSISV